jgi:curli production assembly/transport component CsgF
MKVSKTVIFAAVMLVAGVANASQLVYRPTNPSFGGDPLNGNWLLSQASAQGEGASQGPGFSIDFPDFGGVTQPNPDPDGLPDVDPAGQQ